METTVQERTDAVSRAKPDDISKMEWCVLHLVALATLGWLLDDQCELYLFNRVKLYQEESVRMLCGRILKESTWNGVSAVGNYVLTRPSEAEREEVQQGQSGDGFLLLRGSPSATLEAYRPTQACATKSA